MSESDQLKVPRCDHPSHPPDPLTLLSPVPFSAQVTQGTKFTRTPILHWNVDTPSRDKRADVAFCWPQLQHNLQVETYTAFYRCRLVAIQRDDLTIHCLADLFTLDVEWSELLAIHDLVPA
jgi:hypothetical protein